MRPYQHLDTLSCLLETLYAVGRDKSSRLLRYLIFLIQANDRLHQYLLYAVG